MKLLKIAACFACPIVFLLLASLMQAQSNPLLTGEPAFTDWNQQAPGVRHKITLADLPQPRQEESVMNFPTVIPRPKDAMPVALPGFKVTLYAGGDNGPLQRYQVTEHMLPAPGSFTQPRIIRTAPNGDLFLADSGVGAIDVLRGVGPDGFATGLDHPFGIAFYPAENPRYVYIGNATTVVRIPYHNGDLAWGMYCARSEVNGSLCLLLVK